MTASLSQPQVIEAHNYINGQWVPARSGETFESRPGR